jgi:predicted  nucleic acid-binding Zn-ribbon protein
MIEVILELETIASLSVKSFEFKYLHIVEHFYKQDDDVWQGKVMDNREVLQKTNQKIKDIEANIKEAVKDEIKTAITALESKTIGKINSLDARVAPMEGSMSSMEGKMSSMEGNMSSIEGKLGSMEGKLGSIKEKMEGNMSSMNVKINALDSKLQKLLDILQPK